MNVVALHSDVDEGRNSGYSDNVINFVLQNEGTRAACCAQSNYLEPYKLQLHSVCGAERTRHRPGNEKKRQRQKYSAVVGIVCTDQSAALTCLTPPS
ncbi:hypothetical protein L596_005383 [Steinernema carpocapsae]|uniref:Uncharacterized protein n=1 Tax=Steinernema carpocapsae TaxID=34508 RepID=A0A4V6I8H0_STECR|nr:hypothetical protein L596_005383 [Steinernema carpocapsae]